MIVLLEIDEERQVAPEKTSASKSFRKCVDFHGHLCPGLAIGFQAARILLSRLGASKAPDEELVAFVENDACGADAIQVMTGCTFGKGNFIFKDYGKHAFTLAARKRGRAIRVCLKPDVLKSDPEHLSLFEKVQRDAASPKDKERFWSLHKKRAETILETNPESLFMTEEVTIDLPPKARITPSEKCDICGELTKIDLLREIDGKRVCIPCTPMGS